MIVASLMFSSQAAAAAGQRHAAAAVRWAIKAHARIYIYGNPRCGHSVPIKLPTSNRASLRACTRTEQRAAGTLIGPHHPSQEISAAALYCRLLLRRQATDQYMHPPPKKKKKTRLTYQRGSPPS